MGPALFTIGYQGRTLEDSLNVLLTASVTLLCDVRRNPVSRKPGFSKGVLSASSPVSSETPKRATGASSPTRSSGTPGWTNGQWSCEGPVTVQPRVSGR
jgi:hypothetical protein